MTTKKETISRIRSVSICEGVVAYPSGTFDNGETMYDIIADTDEGMIVLGSVVDMRDTHIGYRATRYPSQGWREPDDGWDSLVDAGLACLPHLRAA